MGSIIVSNLGKAYKQYPSRWSRLLEWLDPDTKPRHQLHWVLQDVSFTINPGESVGIIGINGAGKSTLLKMITGTTRPTTGDIQIQGRMAALLELGMGFHPDFTGRQNAYMAGQLLGYTTEEITHLMPEIESFAEIGDYIDQPVRVYSSGMQMRLAFAVATAHRPDILIIDEALSVGDTYFQHKSFERIREYSRQGSTLLIVSHSKEAIQSICDQAILLSAGKLALKGEPEMVMDYYNAMLANHQNQKITQEPLTNGKVQTISGTGEIIIDQVNLFNKKNEKIEVVNVGESVRLEVVAQALESIPALTIGYMIKDRLGQPVFGTNTYYLKYDIQKLSKNQKITINFYFPANLGQGNYSISIALHNADNHLIKNYEWRDLALLFNVINMDKPHFTGLAWLPSSLSEN